MVKSFSCGCNAQVALPTVFAHAEPEEWQALEGDGRQDHSDTLLQVDFMEQTLQQTDTFRSARQGNNGRIPEGGPCPETLRYAPICLLPAPWSMLTLLCSDRRQAKGNRGDSDLHLLLDARVGATY